MDKLLQHFRYPNYNMRLIASNPCCREGIMNRLVLCRCDRHVCCDCTVLRTGHVTSVEDVPVPISSTDRSEKRSGAAGSKTMFEARASR